MKLIAYLLSSACFMLCASLGCSEATNSSPETKSSSESEPSVALMQNQPPRGLNTQSDTTQNTKKALLFTSQKGTSLSAYFATYDEYESLPSWLPPEGPDVDLKKLADIASQQAHEQIPDGENWKFRGCELNNADLDEGKVQYQYAEFKFGCKSASQGWKSLSVYMTFSGKIMTPETYEFTDRAALNEFEAELRSKYSTWAD